MDPADIARSLEILERYGQACAYCGGAVESKRNRHLDHVIPLARGGPDTLENLVVACASCNRSKWHRMPLDWLAASGHEQSFKHRFPEAHKRLVAWEQDQKTLPFEPNPWLDVDQAAAFYGCSARTLRRRVAAGEVEFQRFGNGPNAKLRFHVEAVAKSIVVAIAWNPAERAWR